MIGVRFIFATTSIALLYADIAFGAEDEAEESFSVMTGLIIGGVAAGFVFIAFIVAIIVWCCCFRKKSDKNRHKRERERAKKFKSNFHKSDSESAFRSSMPLHEVRHDARTASKGKPQELFASAPGVTPTRPKKKRKNKVKIIQTVDTIDGEKASVAPSGPTECTKEQTKDCTKEFTKEFTKDTTKETKDTRSSRPSRPSKPDAKEDGQVPAAGAAVASKSLHQSIQSNHTLYEETDHKTVENIEDPFHIPGFIGTGPLKPDHIEAEKFVHKGELVVRRRQKLDLKHELEDETPVMPKSSDHVKFDSTMNQVVDFGPGVERVLSSSISLKSSSRTVDRTQEDQTGSKGRNS